MRKLVLTASVMALTFALTGTANAQQFQTIDLRVQSFHQASTLRPAAVTVQTRTGQRDGSQPSAAERALLKFSPNMRFEARGLPRCSQSRINDRTSEEARAICGRAFVGRGGATVDVGFEPLRSVPATVTAFNGGTAGGFMLLLLHTHAPQTNTIAVLRGILNTRTNVLDVRIPPLADPAAVIQPALTMFWTRVARLYSVRHRGRTFRLSYANTRGCFRHGSRRLNWVDSLFSFAEGPRLRAHDIRNCRERRR